MEPLKDSKEEVKQISFDRNLHIKYYKRFLQAFPVHYQGLDANRMTLLYFCVSGLDLLGVSEFPQGIADFIYNQQVHDPEKAGFACGPNTGGSVYREGHLAMTYCALCVLTIIGHPMERLNKRGIINALKHYAMPDGSFRCLPRESENDMRFVYCACVISAFLNDWTGLEKELVVDFIVSSQAFDGGFGMSPGEEGHGGSTFTAIAALYLLGKLDAIRHKTRLIQWCIKLQGKGYCGRPNKVSDSCYSFWIGATLDILGVYQFTSPKGNRQFNLSCQSSIGGFGKHPDVIPDIMHSYLGLAGLSMMGFDALGKINPIFNISVREHSK